MCDIFLILGNNIIEVPSVMRSRVFETWSYNTILHKAFEDGARWFSAPKQIIKDESFDFSDLSKPTLMNNEILFDAPNVIRINKDLIFSCEKTPANEVIVIVVVAVLNYLDKRRTYIIGGLH